MKKTSLFLVSATALVLLAASSSARAETAPSPLAPPPHMVPSAMTGHQAPLPVPYAICMSYCREADIAFGQCHDTCKELVPMPIIPGER